MRIIPAQEILTKPYLGPNIRPYILVTRESNQAGQIVKVSSDKHLSLQQVEVVSLANEHEDDGDKSTNAQ